MKRIYSTLNPQMTKNLSKCCKAETKLGGMPDFDDGEVCTVYNVCLKCKNPCGIRYVVDRDWRGRLKEWIETPYGTEGKREELENLVESIIENIEIEHSKEIDEAYRAGLKEGIKKHLKL